MPEHETAEHEADDLNERFNRIERYVRGFFMETLDEEVRDDMNWEMTQDAKHRTDENENDTEDAS